METGGNTPGQPKWGEKGQIVIPESAWNYSASVRGYPAASGGYHLGNRHREERPFHAFCRGDPKKPSKTEDAE